MNVCVLKKVQRNAWDIVSASVPKKTKMIKALNSRGLSLFCNCLGLTLHLSFLHFTLNINLTVWAVFKQVSPLRKYTLHCCLRVTQELAEIPRLLDLLLVIICSKAEKIWLLPFWGNWHIEIFFQQIEENWN